MMSSNQGLWLDNFLFLDAVLVSVLCFIDWIVGETKRQKMREGLGMWWLHCKEMNLLRFHKKSLELSIKVLQWLHSDLGNHKSFVIRCFIISSIPLIIFVGLTIAQCITTNPSIFLKIGFSHYCEYIDNISILFIFNAVGYIVSYKFTIYIIRKMVTKVEGLFSELKYAVFDVAIAMTVCSISFFIPALNALPIREIIKKDSAFLLQLILFFPFIMTFGPLILVFDEDLNANNTLISSFYIILLFYVSTIPTLVHVILSALVLFSKITMLFMKPISEKIMYAFHDSSRGVLSTISIFLGIISKLIQMFYKIHC